MPILPVISSYQPRVLGFSGHVFPAHSLRKGVKGNPLASIQQSNFRMKGILPELCLGEFLDKKYVCFWSTCFYDQQDSFSSSFRKTYN